MIRSILIAVVAMAVVASAYSTGSGMCNVTPQDSTFTGSMGSLTPAQYAALGRTLTVTGLTSGNYTGGGSFTVVINTPGETFKGLLIYAVNSAGTKVGSFSDSNGNFQEIGQGAGTPTCLPSGSTWTHVSASSKASGTTITYTAPKGTGAVTFKAMVVHTLSAYHVLDDVVVNECPTCVLPSSSSSSSTGINDASSTSSASIVGVAIAGVVALVASYF